MSDVISPEPEAVSFKDMVERIDNVWDLVQLRIDTLEKSDEEWDSTKRKDLDRVRLGDAADQGTIEHNRRMSLLNLRLAYLVPDNSKYFELREKRLNGVDKEKEDLVLKGLTSWWTQIPKDQNGKVDRNKLEEKSKSVGKK